MRNLVEPGDLILFKIGYGLDYGGGGAMMAPKYRSNNLWLVTKVEKPTLGESLNYVRNSEGEKVSLPFDDKYIFRINYITVSTTNKKYGRRAGKSRQRIINLERKKFRVIRKT